MLRDRAEIEAFRAGVATWSTVTFETLRRLFDTDEYAQNFAMSRRLFLTTWWDDPIQTVRETDTSLRSQVQELQAILQLVDLLEEIPETVRSTSVARGQRQPAPSVVVTNSTIGTLNLGEIEGIVRNKISTLAPADLKTGLDQVMQAALADQNLNEDQRRQVLEHLDSLAEFGKLGPADRKRAVVTSILAGLSRLLSVAGQAHDVWQQWQPTISGFLAGQQS
jgi:hypothetical protein